MEMDEPVPSSQSRTERPRRLTYRGHKVRLHEPSESSEPMLTIDGADVMVRREETGEYSAPMLNMFATYSSLEELAKSVIDISPVFLSQR